MRSKKTRLPLAAAGFAVAAVGAAVAISCTARTPQASAAASPAVSASASAQSAAGTAAPQQGGLANATRAAEGEMLSPKPESLVKPGAPPARKSGAGVLTGKAAVAGDWTTDAPGVARLITPADLPQPYATESARNGPRLVPQPEGAWPQAPAGFKVERFAGGLNNPRVIRRAPNGDLFVVESAPGRVRVLRDKDGDGKPEVNEVFATGLKRPFGVAFYPLGANPRYVYVANTDSVVRFAYKSGDAKATGSAESVVSAIASGNESVGGGGHWTRDIDFTKNGKRLLVSVGSQSNVSDGPGEDKRACILSYTPDGKDEQVYAWGIRNPVGLAIQPGTGDVWTSVNERDNLGDDLVPDYITRVRENGFYGWPWFYMGPDGGVQDPRHKGKHPELKDRVIQPDVLLQSHYASLDLCFYDGKAFPAEYNGDVFAAQHGSWNRERRVGYKVVRVPLENGRATGVFEDFLTGFVTKDGNVWGRPVGVETGKEGALYVTDDGSNSVWRVSRSAGAAKVARR